MNRNDRTFNVKIQAGLRWKQWKIITGSPGRSIGWDVPPTNLWGNATTIFDEVELPLSAFSDDIKNLDQEDDEMTDEELENFRKTRKEMLDSASSSSRKRRASAFIDDMTDEEAERSLMGSSHKSAEALKAKIDAKRAKQLAKKLAKKKAKAGLLSQLFCQLSS